MTHPEDRLAGYVDGTLEQAERAAVDAHLASCERCREEIELADGARAALAALEDVPVPYGLTDRVIAEAGTRFERRRVVWERLQWAGGLAAAAALVLVVVLNVGGQPDAARQLAATAATGAAVEAPEAAQDASASGLPPFQGLEEQEGVEYDDAGVESLARDTARLIAGETASGAQATFAAADRGVACVTRSGGPVGEPTTTLVRLIQAEYEGTPAYFALFAEGPGAGQPASTIVVWIASEDGCRLLSAASLRF